MRGHIFFVLLMLAACGTPQERCIQRETRDLRTVEKLIAETEANLQRGYALEQVTVYRTEWRLCEARPLPAPPTAPTTAQPQPPRMCLEDVPKTVTRPKVINLADEREKLAELKKKQQQLDQAAKSAIAQCKATYPE